MESYEALNLIAQAETETYLPADPELIRQPTNSAKALIGVGGVFALASALWVLSNVEDWWALPASACIVGVFVACGVSLEKRLHDVKPKVRMPGHVWKQALKQSLPIGVAVGVMTPALLWATESERSFALLLVVAAVYVAAVLAIVWGIRKWVT